MSSIYRTLRLHYNLCYPLTLCLQRVSLELVVADYDRIGSSDPIGRVEIGYNRRGGPAPGNGAILYEYYPQAWS